MFMGNIILNLFYLRLYLLYKRLSFIFFNTLLLLLVLTEVIVVQAELHLLSLELLEVRVVFGFQGLGLAYQGRIEVVS